MYSCRKLNRKKNMRFFVIAFFLIAVGAQAPLLLNQNTAFAQQDNTNKTVDEKDDFRSIERLTKEFEEGLKDREDILDDYFDDDFFRTENDPFKTMREICHNMSTRLAKKGLNIFAPVWRNWYPNRFKCRDIGYATEDTGDNIVATFTIPGLKRKSMDLDINEKRIKLECEIDGKVKEKKQDKNIKHKSKSHRSITKILPTPGGVDANSPNIKKKKDKVIITFQKPKPVMIEVSGDVDAKPSKDTMVEECVKQLLETNECAGCVLSGVQFFKADLSHANLRKANFEGAYLSGANLKNTNLKKANLSGANLSSARLTNANLKKASLKNANLYGANLENANLKKADLSGANLKQAIWIDKTKCGDKSIGACIPD